jgi:hypothetical protein
MKRILLLAAAAALVAACNDDPKPPDNPEPGEPPVCSHPPITEDVSSCQPAATDYRPREPEVNHAATDTWAACISDDNTYHPIDPNITTKARVAAFEEIAVRLWRDGKVPAQADFIAAYDIYTRPEGLASRVQRREDYHYPPAPGGARCRDEGVPQTAPERCVGSAKLLPILDDAFTRGAQGESPRLHAARIEAALLWFLYISGISEVNTCTTTPRDCDSAWAYYTGGTERCAPLGLAAYVRSVAPKTHERAYDATLAVRCWRNLDNETGTATNTALRDQALAQLDRATLRGMALILRQRFSQLSQGTDEERQARLAFINTLGPFLDREARARNAELADVLQTQVSKPSAAEVDIGAAASALDALFPCP